MDAAVAFIKLAERLKTETVAKPTRNTCHRHSLYPGCTGNEREGRMGTEDVHNLGDRKNLQRAQEDRCWLLGDALGRFPLCVDDLRNFNEQTTLTGWSESGTV